MRIESVAAHAFGPFEKQKLELGQGMTVIHGPNESGKSTWHAALNVGLCGIRRGPGRRADEKEFRARHHPWDSESWEVSVVVQLGDERRIELRQNLNNLADCRAHDADSGRDYSTEINGDGTPDGSRWLGLDRKCFVSTACVRQADIQLAKDQAEGLQAYLQRAAATAGAEETAAAAIAKINSFHKEFVGKDWRNSNKPLARAKRQLEQAQKELEEARSAHLKYLQQQEEVEQLRNSLANAQNSLREIQVAYSLRQRDTVRKKVSRAKELADRNPVSPPDPTKLRQQLQDVTNALSVWENRPDELPVGPTTSEELVREIESLPPMPEGDTSPHRSVQDAEDSLRIAQRLREDLKGRMPSQPEHVATGNLTSQEMRDLAVELALEDPIVDPVLAQFVQDSQSKLEALRQPETRRRDSQPVFFLLRPLVLLIRVLGNVLRSLFGKREPRVDFAAIAQASEDLRQAESALGETRFKREEVRKRKESATATVTKEGLPTSAAGLEELAKLAEEADRARSETARWQDDHKELHDNCDGAAQDLRLALESRGASTGQDLSQDVTIYKQECERRDQQTRRANRRADLERSLDEKKRQEKAAAESSRRRFEAALNLEEAGNTVGRSADTEEALAACLRLWRADTEQLIQEQERAKDEWRELKTLLEGQSLADMERNEKRLAHEVESLTEGLDESAVAQVELGQDPEGLLNRLRRDVENSQTDLATKRGQFTQFSMNIHSVAEGEEELDQAEAELCRVTKLDRTLTKTRELLSDAQDRVHRTLAPELRDALKPWLKTVTQGRYNDIRVDVESLAITVSGDGRRWREVDRLSHGTTDQIYLLLRMAMSRYLTKKEETCPLILDDVTVHCDLERQEVILSLLYEISREHQVILFSKEPETLTWAKERFTSEYDRLIQLDPQVVSA